MPTAHSPLTPGGAAASSFELRAATSLCRFLRGQLIDYNGGPRQRQPHYYRVVMATYVELLEDSTLSCRFREVSPPKVPRIALAR